MRTDRSRPRHPPSCRVFIGNIDPSVTVEEIERLFEPFGKVLEPIRMHKGYSFVQYDNTESAEQAIRENNGYMLGGKPIDVQLAKGTAGDKKAAAQQETLGKRKHEEDHRDYYDRRSPQQYGVVQQPPVKRYREQNPAPPLPRPGDASIPIFIITSALENYAQYIQNTLTQHNLHSNIVNLNKTTEAYFTSQAFFSRIAHERYVLVIQQKNEQNRDVAFRAILPDGSSPGFADTPLTDVIQFINGQPNPPVLPILPPSIPLHSHIDPPHPYAPPTQYEDPQLSSMLLSIMEQLKPEYQNQHVPPLQYNYAPPPTNDDVTSLMNTLSHLAGRKQYQ
jgi:hypothetical protein